MSAYIVEDHTIRRMVTYLAQDRNNPHWFRKLHAGFNIDPHESPDEQEALAGLLLALNIRAVNERYGRRDTVAPRVWAPASCSPIQAFKCLTCWLYQCAEGTVPDSELFQLMTEYKGCLAEDIVRTLPEYEACEWG